MIKSSSGCSADMKSAFKLTSVIVFCILLDVNILFRFVLPIKGVFVLIHYTAGICLVVAAVFYFISFIPKGQNA